MSLTANNLFHNYGDTASLRDVSLHIDAGECVALVGESGSGKTTLLRCFNSMVVPESGTVLAAGHELTSLDPVELRRRTGYIPQDGGLLPHWTVVRNASMVAWLQGSSEHLRLGRIALERVGLDPDSHGRRKPGQLSGGQRQRVAIARAIASEPATILLDEPFGALDAITRAELHSLFARLRLELNFTALLVTHDLHEAFLLADKIAVMRLGGIEQYGTPSQLLSEPATPYVRALLEKVQV